MALAIVGHFIVGAAIFAAAIGVRFLVRRSSGGYIVWRALQDAEFYRHAVDEKVLRVENPAATS